MEEEFMKGMNKDSFGSLSHGQLEFGRVHLRKCLQDFCLSLRICRLHWQRKYAETEIFGQYVRVLLWSNLPYILQTPDDLLNENITESFCYWFSTLLTIVISDLNLSGVSKLTGPLCIQEQRHSSHSPILTTFRDKFVRNPYFLEAKMLLFPVVFIKFEQKQFGKKWQGKEYCVKRHLSGKDLVKSIGNKSFPSYLAL